MQNIRFLYLYYFLTHEKSMSVLKTQMHYFYSFYSQYVLYLCLFSLFIFFKLELMWWILQVFLRLRSPWLLFHDMRWQYLFLLCPKFVIWESMSKFFSEGLVQLLQTRRTLRYHCSGIFKI